MWSVLANGFSTNDLLGEHQEIIMVISKKSKTNKCKEKSVSIGIIVIKSKETTVITYTCRYSTALMQRRTRSRLATRVLTLDNKGCKIREEVLREIPTREFELLSQLILEWLVAAMSNICSYESHASCESRPCLEAFTCEWHHFP